MSGFVGTSWRSRRNSNRFAKSVPRTRRIRFPALPRTRRVELPAGRGGMELRNSAYP